MTWLPGAVDSGSVNLVLIATVDDATMATCRDVVRDA
jgi:hypothetical protein